MLAAASAAGVAAAAAAAPGRAGEGRRWPRGARRRQRRKGGLAVEGGMRSSAGTASAAPGLAGVGGRGGRASWRASPSDIERSRSASWTAAARRLEAELLRDARPRRRGRGAAPTRGRCLAVVQSERRALEPPAAPAAAAALAASYAAAGDALSLLAAATPPARRASSGRRRGCRPTAGARSPRRPSRRRRRRATPTPSGSAGAAPGGPRLGLPHCWQRFFALPASRNLFPCRSAATGCAPTRPSSPAARSCSTSGRTRSAADDQLVLLRSHARMCSWTPPGILSPRAGFWCPSDCVNAARERWRDRR